MRNLPVDLLATSVTLTPLWYSNPKTFPLEVSLSSFWDVIISLNKTVRQGGERLISIVTLCLAVFTGDATAQKKERGKCTSRVDMPLSIVGVQ
jgi:hypothetical protein